MHIPDGYLSPLTAGLMYGVSAPFLIRASNKVKRTLSNKIIPLVSIFSALSFIVMMFNIPLPGGTTGHAVGATISTIILGPWLSILSISVALFIQALFFGDGGILALGANIFNLAIVMPLSSYWLYRFFLKLSGTDIKKRALAAGVAGYISINIAAIFTAVELGIQPLLFKDATGKALYFPYGLSVAIPAMMIGHLTLAGLAEGIISGLSLIWINKLQPEMLTSNREINKTTQISKYSWFLLLVLTLVAPIGLLAPGTAWGEWGREELTKLGLGYIPAGFDKWSNFWRSPIPDYDLPGFLNPSIVYILSGLLGIILCIFLIYLLISILTKLNKKSSSK